MRSLVFRAVAPILVLLLCGIPAVADDVPASVGEIEKILKSLGLPQTTVDTSGLATWKVKAIKPKQGEVSARVVQVELFRASPSRTASHFASNFYNQYVRQYGGVEDLGDGVKGVVTLQPMFGLDFGAYTAVVVLCNSAVITLDVGAKDPVSNHRGEAKPAAKELALKVRQALHSRGLCGAKPRKEVKLKVELLVHPTRLLPKEPIDGKVRVSVTGLNQPAELQLIVGLLKYGVAESVYDLLRQSGNTPADNIPTNAIVRYMPLTLSKVSAGVREIPIKRFGELGAPEEIGSYMLVVIGHLRSQNPPVSSEARTGIDVLKETRRILVRYAEVRPAANQSRLMAGSPAAFKVSVVVQGIPEGKAGSVNLAIRGDAFGPERVYFAPLRPRPMMAQGKIAQFNGLRTIQTDKPGDYVWKYTVEAPGYEPAKGEVAFKVWPKGASSSQPPT